MGSGLKRVILISIILVFVISIHIVISVIKDLAIRNVTVAEGSIDHVFIPDYEYDKVPDAKTALLIAEAALQAKYGKRIIFNKPLVIAFDAKNGLWIITGAKPNLSVLCGAILNPTVIIRKSDGAIIAITCEKF